MNTQLELRKKPKITTMYIAKTAILSVMSFLLYVFAKFPLPFIFPAFLDIQFSELPALLAGFSMGPISGCIVLLVRCLLKMTMSSTAFVGELTDLVIGIAYVLPASLIYRIKKDRKHAIIGLLVGILAVEIVSVLINRFISIPFYVSFFFNGNWNILLGIVRPLYPNVTRENFYFYYLLFAIVPFNLLRSGITALLTFFVYKRLSKALHWEKRKNIKDKVETVTNELPLKED